MKSDAPRNLFSLNQAIPSKPFDGSHLYRHCPECGSRWATIAGLHAHRLFVHVAENEQENRLQVPGVLLVCA